MSEEHISLVAKIQHFYEFMIASNVSMLEKAIESKNMDKKAVVDEATRMNKLLDEYERIFISFLYKDGKDLT